MIDTKKISVGLVGLGQMGSAMSRHFLNAGYAVQGFDVDCQRMRDLETAGGRSVAGIADLAGCPIVISMLWDDATTRSAAGILAGVLPAGSIHVAMGTISTALATELRDIHAERGQRYLSAPVFGRPEAAQAARLAIMCAGDAQTFEQAAPLLRTLGTVRRVGADPFQANLMKLMGNNMIFASIELLGEMFTLLRKAGVDEADTRASIVDTLFASPIFSGYADRIQARQWLPAACTFDLATKDNALCLAAAETLGVSLPLVDFMRERIAEAIAAGDRPLDISAIARRAAADNGLGD